MSASCHGAIPKPCPSIETKGPIECSYNPVLFIDIEICAHRLISTIVPILEIFMTAVSRGENRTGTVWALPWIVQTVTLYIFVILWVQASILKRYFSAEPKWGAALPGLDSTKMMKFTMGGHMLFGAVSLLLGPLQLIPFFRKTPVHRWSGRLYCICAMMSSALGLTFIAMKGKLVGGWNMTVAFGAAGATIGYLAYETFRTARERNFAEHRKWALRSYSQILAPMLYRYWYIAAELFGIYNGPVPPRFGGEINKEDDTMPEYFRIVDQLHCWGYWISALLVAEVVIRHLPPMKTSTRSQAEASSPALTSPLIQQTQIQSPDKSYNAIERDTEVRTVESNEESSNSVVNGIGTTLAIVSIIVTFKILTTVFENHATSASGGK